MQILDTMDALAATIGRPLGTSDWVAIDQDRIQRFADATEDHQWIHVDVARAERESPLGGPVAHGFLTLSLLPYLVNSIFSVEAVRTRVNYGLDKVRFVSPVPAGARVRAEVSISDVEPRGDARFLVRNHVVIECEGRDKPACIADSLTLYLL